MKKPRHKSRGQRAAWVEWVEWRPSPKSMQKTSDRRYHARKHGARRTACGMPLTPRWHPVRNAAPLLGRGCCRRCEAGT